MLPRKRAACAEHAPTMTAPVVHLEWLQEEVRRIAAARRELLASGAPAAELEENRRRLLETQAELTQALTSLR